jgi:glycerol uptake facilitator-like aquaporin
MEAKCGWGVLISVLIPFCCCCCVAYSLSGNVENAFHATAIEAFGTGFLCLVIFAATNPKTSVPPVAVPVFVGVAIGLMVCVLGPLTGYVLTELAY